MSTIKQQITSLEEDRVDYESTLESFEENGIYGGPGYDEVVELLIQAEADLRALQLLDEDDQC